MKPSSTDTSNLVVSLRDHLLENGVQSPPSGAIRLILASQSPRRREILDMMGLQGRFEATPSPLDESALQLQLLGKDSKDSLQNAADEDDSVSAHVHYYSGQVVTDPKDYTRILAEEKAKALANQLAQQQGNDDQCALVLGSDTIVVYKGQILEKPKDEEDAKRMLRTLQGNRQLVHTGVALVVVTNKKAELVRSFTDTAAVQFAKLSDSDINAYVATGEPMDKAGAYGIQGIGGQIVKAVEGDFFTVMGLPMHRTSKMLANQINTILSKR